MGYDYAMIRELEARNLSAQRAYQCPFVGAVKSPTVVEGGIVAAARAILAEHVEPAWYVGEEVRGTVSRKEPLPLDDPRQIFLEHLPCDSWHQQQNRGERITLAVAGEFEAR